MGLDEALRDSPSISKSSFFLRHVCVTSKIVRDKKRART